MLSLDNPMRGLLILVNYNQELEIAAVLDSVVKDWSREDTLIVDDGSQDRSPTMAEERGFRVIRQGRNRGVGAGIRTGIEWARAQNYDYVVVMATNGKMKSRDLPHVIEPITSGKADYVQGSRYLSGGGSVQLTQFRRMAIPAVTAATSLLLRRRFTDATCGFRAYKLSLFSDTRFNIHQEWLDHYELEYYLHYWVCRLNYRVVEVPVTMDYSHLRTDRKSKIAPISGWWSMLRPFVYLSLGIKK